MRISDWSSDVCSSDLLLRRRISVTLADPVFKTRYYHKRIGHLLRLDRSRPAGTRDEPELVALDPLSGVTPSEKPPVRLFLGTEQIGRASCRESVCQYV